MEKCKYFEEAIMVDPLRGPLNNPNRQYCTGTRNKELCECGGDVKKCTHFPEKAMAANMTEVRRSRHEQHIKDHADEFKRWYDAFIEAGFNKEQAMQLLVASVNCNGKR